MNLYNKNPNHLLRLLKNDIQQFKLYLNCFSLFENRIIESINLQFGNYIFVDVGFKYVIKVNIKNYSKYHTLLKFIKLETLFNDSLIDFSNTKNSISRKSNWSVIKKAFKLRCILPGKVLNSVKNGFSVGIFGFIGFMPKKYALDNNLSSKSIFIVNSVDVLKKTFVVSQKQIDKTTFRALFKLSSQISYISKY